MEIRLDSNDQHLEKQINDAPSGGQLMEIDIFIYSSFYHSDQCNGKIDAL